MADKKHVSEEYHSNMSMLTMVAVVAIVAIIVMGAVVKFNVEKNAAGQAVQGAPSSLKASSQQAKTGNMAGKATANLLAQQKDMLQGATLDKKLRMTKLPVADSLIKPVLRSAEGDHNLRYWCLDLDTIKDGEGIAHITSAQMEEARQNGQDHILVCGLHYYLTGISIDSPDVSMQCDGGTIIENTNPGFNVGLNTMDTADHAIVTNCQFRNYDQGIRLHSINNYLANNVIIGGHYGIHSCAGPNFIYTNEIQNSIQGIRIDCGMWDWRENTNMIVGNRFFNNWNAIWATTSDIYNNVISNAGDGIKIWQNGYVHQNNVQANVQGIYANFWIDDPGTVPDVLVIQQNSIEMINFDSAMYRAGGAIYYYEFGYGLPLNVQNYYIFKDNQIINNAIPPIAGIIISGDNYGVNIINAKVEGNTITGFSKGIAVSDRAHSIMVRGNSLNQCTTALDCATSSGITWACNKCNGGSVHNDQCTPAASCEYCSGGSPLFAKQQVVQAQIG